MELGKSLQGLARSKASYDRHIYFVDFQALNHPGLDLSPVWFSVIRDPVDKFVSRFHYVRRRRFKEGLDAMMNW